jgi:predicted ATPase
MIRRIVIERFKSFERVDLTLGHFNLFIGPNASGKSNFLDALRVLQGIGYGLTISEILNGKPKSPIGEAWDPIRGGALFARRTAGGDLEEQGWFYQTVRFDVHLDSGVTKNEVNYRLAFEPVGGRFEYESLAVGGKAEFTMSWESPTSDLAVLALRERDQPLEQYSTQPFLTQVQAHSSASRQLRAVCRELASEFADLQGFDPAPRILRQYSSSAPAQRMGSSGENFAAVVKQICEDPAKKAAYVSWLKQLTPRELEDLYIFEGALKEPLFGIRHGLISFPAPVLSDGTLRFAALTAAFFQPSMPRMMTFEEIENGVHPSRLRLVLDLMRSQSKFPAPQVFATSHSPVILDWLNPEDHPFVFLCRRNAESGATEIRTLAELLAAAPPGGARLSDLAVEGWFEAVP